jgi:hypothetical protein
MENTTDAREGPMTATKAQADEIRSTATNHGLAVTVSLSRDYNPATGWWDGKIIDATVTAETTFTPGDTGAYVKAERNCNEILRLFRMIRPGSTWGTDSGSVGGHAGLTGGFCRMSKSGVEIRLARQFV